MTWENGVGHDVGNATIVFKVGFNRIIIWSSMTF